MSPRYEPRRRDLFVLASVAALLNTCHWVNEPASGPSTSSSHDAGAPDPRANSLLRPAATAPAPAPDLTLHIWVRALSEARYVKSWPKTPFEAIWPDDDDPRWRFDELGELRTPAALRALDDFHRPGTVSSAARAEGFAGGSPDLSSPETALLSLYATWVADEEAWYGRWKEFQAAHVPVGESWESITSAERARIVALEGHPEEDFASLDAMALEVLATWPDHPVADHAIFAAMRAAVPKLGARPDEAELADLLLSIDSDVVQEHAAAWLTRERFEPLTPDLPVLLDALERIQPASSDNELRVSAWALDRAVALQDWGRASAWATRLRSGLAAQCGEPEPRRQSACDVANYQLRDVAGRLTALGLVDAQTWQEALTAEAWRCHLGPGPHAGTSRSVATWDGDRWSFGPWDVPTALTRCMDRVLRTDVVPDRVLSVDLTVEGPDLEARR